jgi:hypothetical protein
MLVGGVDSIPISKPGKARTKEDCIHGLGETQIRKKSVFLSIRVYKSVSFFAQKTRIPRVRD